MNLSISSIKQVSEKYKQQLLLACYISELLAPLELLPVLVGGATVEFYTFGNYQTADIELMLANYKKIDWSYLHKAANKTQILNTLQKLQGAVKKRIDAQV